MLIYVLRVHLVGSSIFESMQLHHHCCQPRSDSKLQYIHALHKVSGLTSEMTGRCLFFRNRVKLQLYIDMVCYGSSSKISLYFALPNTYNNVLLPAVWSYLRVRTYPHLTYIQTVREMRCGIICLALRHSAMPAPLYNHAFMYLL